MTNPNLEKQAREYFLKGGGGHEDGEAGATASTFTFDGMVEMAAAFAEHMVEKAAINGCYCVCHSGSSSRPGCVHCRPEYYVEGKFDPYCHLDAEAVARIRALIE